LPKLLQEGKVDGLFVLGCMATDYLRMLSEKVTVPIVYLDFYLDDIKEDSVISNSFYGTYQITHYLLQKGHRQIAFVGTLFSTKSITDRYLGYEKAMMEMGLEVKKEWIVPDRSGARNSMEELPFPAELPTAFVCNCDLTASRVIKQLEESGHKVPEEVSVVGYDDYLYMDGGGIFNFTLDAVPALMKDVLIKNTMKTDDVDYYIFHQANKFMLNTIRKVCILPQEKFYINFEETGNTVSSTVMIGLKQCWDTRTILPGMKVMVAGFGVGLSWGGTILKF